MTILVRIPTALRDTVAGARELPLAATSVAAALNQIEQEFPLLYRSVCDETGVVRKHLNVFINKSLVRDPDGLSAQLSPGDIVTIMTAVSGG